MAWRSLLRRLLGRPGDLRTYVRALGQPLGRQRRRAAKAAEARRRGDPDVRRTRGRSAIRFHEIQARSALEPRAKAIADAVPFHRQSVQGLHPCLQFLLRPSHPHVPRPRTPGRDFEREIVVKVNVPEVLRAELGAPSLEARARRARHQHRSVPVGREPLQADAGDLGGAARLRARQARSSRSRRWRCATSTLLKELADGPGMSVYFSVPTLDERAWRETEPHTPSPRARLEARAQAERGGRAGGILIAPLMPGINDTPEQVAEIVRARRGRGRDQRRRGARCTCAAR